MPRFTGVAGLTGFVLIFVPVVGGSGQEPGFGGDATSILTFFRSAATPIATQGRFVLVLGVIVFAWFVVGLTMLLAEAEAGAESHPSWRSTAAGASGLLFVASAMNGYWQAAAYRVDQLSPELATFAFDLGNLQFANGWVAMGSFAVGVGWVLVRTRFFPRWLGWMALVAGAGLIGSRAVWTTDIWLLPYAVFWVWLVMVSVRLLRSGHQQPVDGARS
ncbi:MAG: hypothetical protein ABWX96_06365 [Propionibacteriaceae bacterium]